MALTDFVFDSVTSAPYYSPMSETNDRPAGTTFALDGSAHHSRAAYIDGFYPGWMGHLEKATYDSLYTKFVAKTQGTLVCTHGSCTAILIRMERTDVPGDVTGHFLAVRLTWQRLTDWS